MIVILIGFVAEERLERMLLGWASSRAGAEDASWTCRADSCGFSDVAVGPSSISGGYYGVKDGIGYSGGVRIDNDGEIRIDDDRGFGIDDGGRVGMDYGEGVGGRLVFSCHTPQPTEKWEY
jgi:hypothetical protein